MENVTGTFHQRLFPSSLFFRVGGGQRGEPLSASHATAHHLPSLTRPGTALRRALIQSANSHEEGRVFVFIRGAYQSLKLHKRYRFQQVFR